MSGSRKGMCVWVFFANQTNKCQFSLWLLAVRKLSYFFYCNYWTEYQELTIFQILTCKKDKYICIKLCFSMEMSGYAA